MESKRVLSIDEMKVDAQKAAELKYLQTKVDLSTEVPEPVPVLKIGDCSIFSRGDISTIGGRAKSRKSFLIVRFSADYLNSNNTGKILIVDTEMGKARAYKTARRVHRLMEWDAKRSHERLIVLSLREYVPSERVAYLQEAIEDVGPELVFVDGVRDLVTSINSEEEATQTVGMLMKMSVEYDCHICSVLHENNADGKLRGHLGTEVINKSETVLSVTKNEEISTVEPKQTRDMPFDKFSFRINDDGLPEYCDAPLKSAKIDRTREVFETILSDGVTLSYSDLRSKVMDAEGIKTSAAQNRIQEATSAGIIIKGQDGYYFPKQVNDENTTPF